MPERDRGSGANAVVVVDMQIMAAAVRSSGVFRGIMVSVCCSFVCLSDYVRVYYIMRI